MKRARSLLKGLTITRIYIHLVIVVLAGFVQKNNALTGALSP